ncbi:uncharacterized protein RSE6_05041 [Rhynchosporium secalis]|uniref:Uncharacterized protein n=1 Tax=Rhynchosporium secalis TaxID=38038 RepID=A0A1E1M6U6_RHYSE|nr:uncharacterized protein RSE6_05041 [Rhynchosporium secalis]
MDEKGARIYMPAGEEVVVPVGIKEMYCGVLENRMSVTIIEAVYANRTVVPLVIIIPGVMIMASFFQETITSLERLTVSESGYTHEGIILV